MKFPRARDEKEMERRVRFGKKEQKSNCRKEIRTIT